MPRCRSRHTEDYHSAPVVENRSTISIPSRTLFLHMRMTDKTAAAVIAVIAVLFSFSCEDSKMRAAKKSVRLSERLPDDSLRRLSQQTIYFGHESVGYKIEKK